MYHMHNFGPSKLPWIESFEKETFQYTDVYSNKRKIHIVCEMGQYHLPLFNLD